MKRVWGGVLALCLLLSGCAGGGAEETAEQPVWSEEAAAPEGLTLELEHAVYDPSLTSYTYLISNGTGETVEFGAAYAIQRRDGDGWADLTVKDGVGWDDIGYALEPGGTMALTCGFWLYEEQPEAGAYRLVKTVGDVELTAEFALGDSVYTAQTPYGFSPLEDLPADYGADAALTDGAVVFTATGAENTQAVGAFLEKVSLGVPCQLRTIQVQGEGVPMIIDVICESDSFLWRMCTGGGSQVTERRLSYIVTDGTDLYLSDGADWDAGEQYGDQRIFLVPPLQGTAWVADVEAMTAVRLEGNAARYKVWSADGVWDACLTEEPTVFWVSWHKPGEGSGGSAHDLADWDGLETAITGISWREDGVLMLKCQTADGSISRLTFDPETETLTGA